MAKIKVDPHAFVTKTHIKPNNKVLKIIPQSPADINNSFIEPYS